MLRNLERILISVQHRESTLLVGETGTGKTTMVQELASILNQKLHVFNISQNTDSIDLFGGYKPVDVKFLIVPTYEKFLFLFKKIIGSKGNEQFLEMIQSAFEKSKGTQFIKCVNHGLKSINSKKIEDQEMLEQISALVTETKQLAVKIKRAENGILFRFIEGQLIKSIQSGEWILLDEINLASDEVLSRIVSIIEQKSIVLNERGDIEQIKFHKNFRLFCCMNPHHSSAGKKKLPVEVRSKMTEIFIDELMLKTDLMPIVQSGLPSSDYSLKIMEFYIKVKTMIFAN